MFVAFSPPWAANRAGQGFAPSRSDVTVRRPRAPGCPATHTPRGISSGYQGHDRIASQLGHAVDREDGPFTRHAFESVGASFDERDPRADDQVLDRVRDEHFV